LKLWSFYVDLEESIGTVESAKAVYDKILDLKIANAQIIINYAAFLEENQYWEDSFRVGVDFPRPAVQGDNLHLRYTNVGRSFLHSLSLSRSGIFICPNS
jgi:hypothetical protein